ncbi:porin family protein [Hymenobacter antarcticus]|uniref:Outer membrane protein beta-barrel domain-containing protein n=1 Tax=Hymenobacter antarcticus TaxID=486270 RepID=A0ABP7P816_9BACT
MKKLFSTGLAASALLLATSAQAQISFGPRVGLNVTNLSYDLDGEDEPSSKYQYGAQVGATLNAQFGNLSVQPSLLFTMKGDQAKSSGSESNTFGGQTFSYTYETKQSLRLNYLELPVNLVYSTNGAEGGFQVFAGPYVALGLSGKVKSDSKTTITAGGATQTNSSSDESDVEFVSKEGKDDKAYLRNLDAGFNMGVGYKVGGIQAQLGYGLGLSNLVPNDTNDKDPDITVRNRGFQLSLSYFFQ